MPSERIAPILTRFEQNGIWSLRPCRDCRFWVDCVLTRVTYGLPPSARHVNVARTHRDVSRSFLAVKRACNRICEV